MTTPPTSRPLQASPRTSTAVIICTHLLSRLDQLAEAVASVAEQGRSPDELVVVVDGDETLHAAVTSRLVGTRVIHVPGPRGLSAARNAGVENTSSDIVLFLDDDALAAPDWVATLVSALDDPDVLGASGRSLPLWEAPAPRWFPDEFLWTVGCSYLGQPDHRSVVRNAYGGCCALRRALFSDLGGYDSRLGRSPWWRGGGEEAELSLRAQVRWPRGVFVYEPASTIRHRVPADRMTLGYVLARAYAEGRGKARISRMTAAAHPLSPERAFVLNLFRRQTLRRWLRGDPTQLAGVALLSTAVVLGLLVGRLERIPQSALVLSEARA